MRTAVRHGAYKQKEMGIVYKQIQTPRIMLQSLLVCFIHHISLHFSGNEHRLGQRVIDLDHLAWGCSHVLVERVSHTSYDQVCKVEALQQRERHSMHLSIHAAVIGETGQGRVYGY